MTAPQMPEWTFERLPLLSGTCFHRRHPVGFVLRDISQEIHLTNTCDPIGWHCSPGNCFRSYGNRPTRNLVSGDLGDFHRAAIDSGVLSLQAKSRPNGHRRSDDADRVARCRFSLRSTTHTAAITVRAPDQTAVRLTD